jgi:hypothetical protein
MFCGVLFRDDISLVSVTVLACFKSAKVRHEEDFWVMIIGVIDGVSIQKRQDQVLDYHRWIEVQFRANGVYLCVGRNL